MTIKTFVTCRGHRDPFKATLPDHFNLEIFKSAIRDSLSEDVNDWLFFDENTEIELDADNISKLDTSSVIRVHCHPCRRVTITVNFECDQIKLKIPPVAPLKVVLHKAVKKLKLDPAKFDDYLLTLANNNESLPLHTPVGSLSGAEDCDIELDLVLEPRING